MARTKRKANLLTPVTAPAEPTARIYKAAGYIRLSVEDGGRPGADTLEGQKALIRGFISQQPDIELVGLFCDNGKTGTDFARPQFEQMMELVRRGKADCLVVKDLSRFGRNYKETGNYLERIFPFLGVRFIAINDAFDTLTAERTQEGYIVPLKNLINEVYSKDISRKSGTALQTKQLSGDFIGAWAPYGYDKSRSRVISYEQELKAAAARMIELERLMQNLYEDKCWKQWTITATPIPLSRSIA